MATDTDTDTDSPRSGAALLRRKIHGADGTGPPARMTLARALELGLAQAALAEHGIDLAATGIERLTAPPDGLAGLLPDPGLIAQLEAADGRRGLVALCPALLAAVVEAATVGSVLSGEVAPRRATETDRAMAAGLIETTLATVAALAEGLPEAAAMAGLEVGALRRDPRAAVLALRDCAHAALRLTVVAGRAERTGTLVVVLPPTHACARGGQLRGARWERGLQRAVFEGTVRLEAVLARLPLTLARLQALAPGQTLPLTGARLDAVELLAPDGGTVATVRLGRIGERKAVRLVPPSAAAGAAPPAGRGDRARLSAGKGAAPGPGATPAPMAEGAGGGRQQ